MKRYVAGEPYAARRITAFYRRIERLAPRARMKDLLAEGLDAFIGFQDELGRLQFAIQRDIGELKKVVRKEKQAVPSLEELRRLRWLARCLGDALAWEVLLFDRQTIAALSSGPKPSVVEINPNTQAVVAMAGHLLGQQFGVPIIHDITNWLRIGDITFMKPGKKGEGWEFQTVELKSTVNDSQVSDDGTINANVTVNIYSNEPMKFARAIEVEPQPETKAPAPPTTSSNGAPPKRNLRLERQMKRLDGMKARRDMKENAITTIDGIPNLMFNLTDSEKPHWADLRRAIRTARRDGFAFFSIDKFIGYTLFYQKEGVTEEHMHSFGPRMVEHVQNDLLSGTVVKPSMVFREIPMKEEYDYEHFPIKRFFSYDIPQVAINDLLRHRLIIAAVVNWGRLDAALIDEGFSVLGINATPEDQPLPYSVEISWSTGDKFRVDTPMNQVSREVDRGIHEFLSLSDVVNKIASIKLIPETISYEDWDASLKAQMTDDDEAVVQTKAK